MAILATSAGFVLAVAIHAELHEERLALIGELHRLHGTVAVVAVDSAVYVDGVVEVDELRKLVDSHPPERHACPVA